MATRRLIAAALAVVAGLAGLVVFAVVRKDEAGRQQSPTTTQRPARVIVQPPIRVPGGLGVATFFDRPATLFGDPVGAEVEVLADRRVVAPNSVRVRAEFEPYRFMAPPARERFDIGNFVWLKYHYWLLCLRRACRPTPAEARTFNFPEVRISFRRSSGSARAFTRPWPPLVVSSRMKPDDLQRGGFRAREFPLPALSYRFKPGPLSAVLFLGAGLATLVGGVLIWFALTTLVRARLRRAKLLSELEQELALLLASLEGDEAHQRTALDRLSGALWRSGEAGLATDARHLAWSEDGPTQPDVQSLAGQVEDRIEGSS